MSELPPGFVLDPPSAAGGLPPGFALDAPDDPASITLPQRFQKRAPHPQANLGTFDEAAGKVGSLIDRFPVIRDDKGQPIHPSVVNTLGEMLRGGRDLLTGRVMMDEAGNPLSIRPTPDSTAALALLGTASPAAGTGAAITQMAENGAPLSSLYAMNRPTTNPVADALLGKISPPANDSSQLVAALRAPGTAVPDSVGSAATPATLSTMAPREAAASRATGERYTLGERPIPGDTTEYVPGIKPTLAEIEQTVERAREAKSLKMERGDEFAAKDLGDAEIYQDFFGNLAGTPTMVMRAKEARSAQAGRDLEATWKNKTDADLQPVFDHIETVLAGPDGKRPLVEQSLNSVVKQLRDSKGNPVTNPEILYGVRKHIDDMVSKEAQREKPLNARVEALLLDVKSQLDQQIEAAAPGFRNYLTNFAQASKPIDVMNLLQEAAPNLFQGANRIVAFNRYDRFMKDLISERSAAGTNAAKSIDDATWNELVAMHKSLQRTAGAAELARAPGSDTTQNFVDMAKRGGTLAAHAAAALTMPVVGNMLVPIARKAMADRQTALALARHLNPDLAKLPDNGRQALLDALRNETAANAAQKP